MAKVLGTSGRYVSQEAIKLRRRIVTQVFIVVAGLGIMEGIFLSPYVPSGNSPRCPVAFWKSPACRTLFTSSTT